MSIVTIKLPYTSNDKETILSYIKNYNSLLKFTYNRVLEGITSTKELLASQKTMNNIFLDTYFKSSAMFEAKALSKKNKNLIFGGKPIFLKRAKNEITKEEFQSKKLLPLCVIGISHDGGNTKFKILDEKTIRFQPNRHNHFYLELPNLKKSLKKDLIKLLELQNQRIIPITYRISPTHVYLSFENNLVQEERQVKAIKNRVFAIDLNPNYIGYSIVDWKSSSKYKVIHSGVLSNKQLNDEDNALKVASNHSSKIKLSNKRKYENIESVKWLVNLAKHYGCEIFAIEKLNIDSSDKNKGRQFNKLVNNQWNRGILYEQLKKRCELVGIYFQEVVPQYSSFIGNLAYRRTKLPDMCLSSIEIGRRGYEFYSQYVRKDKPVEKNIVFPISRSIKNKIVQSLEELNYQVEDFDLVSIYRKLKTLRCKIRVPLSELAAVFSRSSIKSKVKIIYNSV